MERLWVSVLAAVAGLLLASAAFAQYVTIRTGSVPIVVSIPHDGRLSLLDWPQRTCGSIVDKSTWGCYKTDDTGTRELANEMFARLDNLIGPAYYVRNEVKRRWVDPNRPPWGNMAYENEGGKAVYDEYHAALDVVCAEILRRWGRGFLLDLHHTDIKYEPTMKNFNRGSGNGTSTPNLLALFGNDALFGPQSIFGYLRSRGYTVQPSAPGEPEKWRLSWISDIHGGHRPDGLDAFILEIRYPFYPSQSLVARDLADALAVFLNAYLPLSEESPLVVTGDAGATGTRLANGAVEIRLNDSVVYTIQPSAGYAVGTIRVDSPLRTTFDLE